jgi:XTP/dITP diphosphohydrolase
MRKRPAFEELVFVTSNPNKVKEVQAAITAAGLDISVEQRNMGYTEPQVDTLEGVVAFGLADIRARLRGGRVSVPVMVEDSGLFIDRLNGFPGVFSAYVFRTIGCEGVLRLMGRVPRAQRGSAFKSVIGLLIPGKDAPMHFRGECRGAISLDIAGTGGFGYDPIFVPREGNRVGRTFAEMTRDEKNAVSHRGRSVEALVAFLGRGL